jgi:hypothetical protein
MRSIFGMALVLGIGLTACSDDGTEPNNADLSGMWQFSGTLANSGLGVNCNATGTATITQTGATIAGSIVQQGSCSTPAGAIDNSGTSPIMNGQVSGSNVSFRVGGCSYGGTISGNPPDRMSGSATCTVTFMSLNVQLAGTWQATH